MLEGRLSERWAVAITAIEPPREWPVRVTLVALYLEMPERTAAKTAAADLLAV